MATEFHFVLLLCCCFLARSVSVSQERLHQIASSLEMFVDELPDMPKLKGYVARRGGVYAPAHLEIGMFETNWKFHRDLPETRVFAYGTRKERATVPGPTIEALQGVETSVRWENHLPSRHILPWDRSLATAIPKHGGVPTVVHLHGGIVEPESDGNSMAWFTAGFKDSGPAWKKINYSYLNVQQPGNLWYHDHALGLTRVNLLAGLVGVYTIRSPSIEKPLKLPSGPYDRSLVLFDRNFNKDGSLYMNSTGNDPSVHPQWQPQYFGDVIIVNGKAWPYMNVQRRKYRFRIVNVANARYFTLALSNGLSMIQIGSDSTYLHRPVTIKKLVLGPSEIADIIIDFNKSSTSKAILRNSAPYPFPEGAKVNDLNSNVLKFVIQSINSEVVYEAMPRTLVQNPRANKNDSAQTRYITMYEYDDSKTGMETSMRFNNLTYDAPVTETPKQGTSELWHIINLTMHSHTLHIHLGLFVVLKQTELLHMMDFQMCMEMMNDAMMCKLDKYAKGKVIPTPANEGNWKNVVKTPPGFVTTILVQFSMLDAHHTLYPFNASAEPGYVYHCHMLDHEDNEMMRPLKIVQ
ncbi:hypothetical protein SUGI_0109910 [Cryptomeria japonica]|uniref:multicopper oxidase LPR1 n=1 Tax=Cryptomeria japonica TaxID=3369 RepID=UPI002408E92D|nr:multicopper oxidase LPR1 [Cryptomeria japonica]XP_057862347.1 multicopper oxidase LPR1 [Cryptomeria japonica]XP_057862348.1 multicopper oxidase LPR1 [Cryptomeria japonica]XP_057862350.1 multicopper oxidase LPR1 [Cryptomeria japonica]GLJ09450.1 hypothetical protein SUGI_0109910 [Cryptomeria japonica]